MLVEAALGNADFGGDILHGHQVITLVGEQAVDGIEDGFLAGIELLLAERDFQCHGHCRLSFEPG